MSVVKFQEVSPLVSEGVDKLTKLEKKLNAYYIDRKEVAHTAILALMCRHHHLQIGPPGTAKSALVRSISDSFSTDENFQYSEKLMHRTMEQDDLFGVADLEQFKAGNAWRNTVGSVVTADIFFADELYRMSDINAAPLLSVVNERRYPNGKGVDDCSLVSMFAGTNELFEGTALDAFHSRILFKHQVEYVPARSFTRFLKILDSDCETASIGLTRAHLDAIYDYLPTIEISKSTITTLMEIRKELVSKDLPLHDTMDDRKVVAMLMALRAEALFAGDSVVSVEHLRILKHCLWAQPEQAKEVAKIVEENCTPWVGAADQIVKDLRKEMEILGTYREDQNALITLSSIIKGLGAQVNDLAIKYEADVNPAANNTFKEVREMLVKANTTVLKKLGIEV